MFKVMNFVREIKNFFEDSKVEDMSKCVVRILFNGEPHVVTRFGLEFDAMHDRKIISMNSEKGASADKAITADRLVDFLDDNLVLCDQENTDLKLTIYIAGQNYRTFNSIRSIDISKNVATLNHGNTLEYEDLKLVCTYNLDFIVK